MTATASQSTAIAAASAAPASDVEQAVLYLRQARDGILGALKGVSNAQWKFKPAPDRWSLAEIVEHVIFVQERVLGPIRDQLADAPPPGGDGRQVDAVVIGQFPNRLRRFQAPPFAQPGGRFATPAEALDQLVKNTARLAEYIESTPDLRQHGLQALPLKLVSEGAYESLDGYQWVLAAAAHTERHTKQILEVKADAGYPGH